MSIDNSKMKKVLEQLNAWYTKHYPQVQSVYDDCAGYTLQQLVYYLLGVVKENTALTVSATDEYNELYTFVHDYFDNLDVQEEVNNKIDSLIKDGTIENILKSEIKFSPVMVDSTDKMHDINTIYVLSTNGHIYYYNGESFVDSGLIYTNNENYVSRSTQYLTTDISTTLIGIPTNSIYALASTSPDIFPDDYYKTSGGTLVKLSPLTQEGYSCYIYTSKYSAWFGYSYSNDNVEWINTNINFYNIVYTNETFKEKFTSINALHGNNIIACSGKIDGFEIVKGSLFTIFTSSPRIDAGYTIIIVIDEYNLYYGFNNNGSVNLFQVNSNTENISDIAYNLYNAQKVVITGDSIVAGLGGTGYSPTGRLIGDIPGHSSPAYSNENGTCWANSLVDYLETNYKIPTVWNNGVSGINSNTILQAFNTLIPSDTDICILSVGINDRAAYTPDQTFNNIQNIINMCKSQNTDIIVLTNIQNTSPELTYSNSWQVNNAIESACSNKCPCIKMFSELNYYLYDKNIELNSILADGLHPNDDGYSIMFELIKKLLGI